MGENGAGKSTMVKMLVGALRPDSGTILLEGKALEIRSVRDAIAAGIVPVYQHSTLFPDLTVAENLCAFDIASRSIFKRGEPGIALESYLEAANSIGLKIDPAQATHTLSMAECQLLEIVRGVARNCKVLLLDEPTAALTAQEADRLFAVIQKLQEQGKGIIFISHKLNEITQICDVITVLRDGKTELNGVATRSLSHRDIIDAMVGPVSGTSGVELPEVGAVRVTVSSLSSAGAFNDISLSVGRGEIVGIAGLIGSGAIEVGEALSGARTISEGTILVDGVDVSGEPRRTFKKAGVGLVPADRTAHGIFPGLSCATNAAAASYEDIAFGSFLSQHAEYAASERWFKDLRVKPADPSVPISSLSGGNQQKLIIIRNLLVPDMKVLVALEPTRGVDVSAREAIHNALILAACKGISVIVASSDLDEVMALSHQIYVMRAGRLAKSFQRGAEPAEILACISETDSRKPECQHATA
jgi:ribose transport system ATP-binding protein/rhamnose transport system ATP-binding protein